MEFSEVGEEQDLKVLDFTLEHYLQIYISYAPFTCACYIFFKLGHQFQPKTFLWMLSCNQVFQGSEYRISSFTHYLLLLKHTQWRWHFFKSEYVKKILFTLSEIKIASCNRITAK